MKRIVLCLALVGATLAVAPSPQQGLLATSGGWKPPPKISQWLLPDKVTTGKAQIA